MQELMWNSKIQKQMSFEPDEKNKSDLFGYKGDSIFLIFDADRAHYQAIVNPHKKDENKVTRQRVASFVNAPKSVSFAESDPIPNQPVIKCPPGPPGALNVLLLLKPLRKFLN